MTAFIAIAAVLVALAVGLLAWPLLRKRGGTEGARPIAAAATVAAVLPAAAFAVYFAASNWNWRASTTAPTTLTRPDIERAVRELEAKLAKEPDDVAGWKLLGRSATVVGDYPRALSAFREAYARTQGRDAEAVVGYAESLVLTDEREIDGEASGLFEKALELAPDNPRALWYGGIVAYRRGDLALAQQRWVELQEYDIPADLRQVLAERLASARREVASIQLIGADERDFPFEGGHRFVDPESPAERRVEAGRARADFLARFAAARAELARRLTARGIRHAEYVLDEPADLPLRRLFGARASDPVGEAT